MPVAVEPHAHKKGTQCPHRDIGIVRSIGIHEQQHPALVSLLHKPHKHSTYYQRLEISRQRLVSYGIAQRCLICSTERIHGPYTVEHTFFKLFSLNRKLPGCLSRIFGKSGKGYLLAHIAVFVNKSRHRVAWSGKLIAECVEVQRRSILKPHLTRHGFDQGAHTFHYACVRLGKPGIGQPLESITGHVAISLTQTLQLPDKLPQSRISDYRIIENRESSSKSAS